MTSIRADFEREGYAIVSNVLRAELLQSAVSECEAEVLSKSGTRNFLRHQWVRAIAQSIMQHAEIGALLSPEAKPVQCTYFAKTLARNWLVAPHRDLSIPVGHKFDAVGWSGWSVKEGVYFVQPPREILESIVIVRIHLEDNGAENGPLQVVPGSHRVGASDSFGSENRVICEVPKGGALVMRPLLVHSSSKLQSGTRRVMHFLFGPQNLPGEAEWAHAV